MDKNDYTLLRSKVNYRMFTEKDIMAMRYFNELREKSNIKVEQAARIVIEKFRTDPSHDVRAPYTEGQTRYDSQNKGELKEMVQDLAEKVDPQQRYIENSLQSHDEKLTTALRELQKTKKLEQTQERQGGDPGKKRGFFSRPFQK